MRQALHLARRGLGSTSPNPMVGAVLVKGSRVLGAGWHRKAGGPHAEIEAIRDAQRRGHSTRGATLYVTLEPCSTHGRTPPCTEAIVAAGIRSVVAGATDPNPRHRGRGFVALRRARLQVETGVLKSECESVNEAFNHWIVRGSPFVTVKAAMTLDGKIATASGESKWITGPLARAHAMRLRRASDAILVGINTVLADDPSLTVRGSARPARIAYRGPRRIVLDAYARSPLTARLVTDAAAALTTIVVGPNAPRQRVRALARRVRVITAPARRGRVDLDWLLNCLGKEDVGSLLVEGGGEVNAAFLLGGHAQRVAFFYAPKVLGGRDALRAVAGEGARGLADMLTLREIAWRRVGLDLFMTARVDPES
jgi:diaminohydroxyphosphoribosylaminopyrimidine deaminase/5-amino-6-(5-phosphoribosylamino)uracil reductase